MLFFTWLPEGAVGFCVLLNALFTISFTRSKAISVLSVTESFKYLLKNKLAIYFGLCSWGENSWGLHFSVYTSILFLSIGRMTPFLNNDHLNTPLPVQWMFLQTPRQFSDIYKCGARRRKRSTRTRKIVCLQTFHLRISTWSFNFKCVNRFF